MEFKYLKHYPDNIKEAVNRLYKEEKLGVYLKSRYNEVFVSKDKELYILAKEIKDIYLKKQKLPERILFDSKIELTNQALGLHSFIPVKQGKKIKRLNEIKISSRFKKMPKEFLLNVLVHELCHLKEKEHNKAFYNLCTNIKEDYFQVELDLRIYLTYLDIYKKPLWNNNFRDK